MVTGNKPTYSYRDPLLDHLDKDLFHTSIRLGSDGCSFSILNLKSKTYLGIAHYDFPESLHPDQWYLQLEEILSTSPFFQDALSSVSIDLDHPMAVVIPDALFISEKASEYLQIATAHEGKGNAKFEKLQNTAAWNVFYAPPFIKQSLEKKFRHIHIRHFSSTLIDSCLRIQKNNTTPTVILHHSGHRFQLLYTKEGKLVFYNDFSFTSPEDYMYFLLYAMDQLKLSTDTTPIVLTGQIDKNSEIYKICYKYIRHISFGQRPKELQYSYVLKELADQYHFNLYNQYLCES